MGLENPVYRDEKRNSFQKAKLIRNIKLEVRNSKQVCWMGLKNPAYPDRRDILVPLYLLGEGLGYA